MSVIYLKHPVHGTKVAISEAEAEHDRKNGWELVVPDNQVHNFMASLQSAPKVTNDHSKRPDQRSASVNRPTSRG